MFRIYTIILVRSQNYHNRLEFELALRCVAGRQVFGLVQYQRYVGRKAM